MNTVQKEYDVKPDRKNRLTIPGAHSSSYHVHELDDGTIILMPHPEPETAPFPKKTLKEMDLDIKNMKADITGAPVELAES